MESPRELTGWGEIAGYLGVTERTALTYEQKLGLPVHRLPGVRGRVWAVTAEIDAWKRNVPNHVNSPPSARRRRWPALAAGLLAVALVVIWVFSNRAGQPATYFVTGNVLTVTDAQKRVCWSHRFAVPPNVMWDHQSVLFSDFSGTGHIGTLFNYIPHDQGSGQISVNGTALCLFDEDGHLRWSTPFGTAMVSDGQRYPAGMFIVNLLGRLSRPRPDGGLIIAGGHHQGSWLYEVEIYTGDGRKVGTYVHPGWFFAMAVADANQDGVEEILLGGVNNSYGETGYASTLVVLDSRNVSGQGSVPPGGGRQVVGVPTGTELAQIVIADFADSTYPDKYCRIDRIETANDYIRAHATRDIFDGPHVEYHFDRHLRLLSVLPDARQEQKLLAGLPQPLTPTRRREEALRLLGHIKVLRNRWATD